MKIVWQVETCKTGKREIEVCIPLYTKGDIDGPHGAWFWMCAKVTPLDICRVRAEPGNGINAGFECDGFELTNVVVTTLDHLQADPDNTPMQLSKVIIRESHYWDEICEKAMKVFQDSDWDSAMGDDDE